MAHGSPSDIKTPVGIIHRLDLHIPKTGISDSDLRFLEQAKERLGLGNFMRIMAFMPFLAAYRQVKERKIKVPEGTIPEIFILRSFLPELKRVLRQHSEGVNPPRREIHFSGKGLSIQVYKRRVHVSTIPLELRFVKGKPTIKSGKTEFTDEIKRMASASSSHYAKKFLDEIKKRERNKTNRKRMRPR